MFKETTTNAIYILIGLAIGCILTMIITKTGKNIDQEMALIEDIVRERTHSLSYQTMLLERENENLLKRVNHLERVQDSLNEYKALYIIKHGK